MTNLFDTFLFCYSRKLNEILDYNFVVEKIYDFIMFPFALTYFRKGYMPDA